MFHVIFNSSAENLTRDALEMSADCPFVWDRFGELQHAEDAFWECISALKPSLVRLYGGEFEDFELIREWPEKEDRGR